MSATTTRYDNSGLLFRVARKRTERAPDMEGNAVIAGKEFRIVGWVKLSKDGKRKFLALKFAPEEPGRA
jgi:hypothetical protein